MSLWKAIRRAVTLPSSMNSLRDAARNPLGAAMGLAQLASYASGLGLVNPGTFLGKLGQFADIGGLLGGVGGANFGELLRGKGNLLDYVSLVTQLYGMKEATGKQQEALNLMRQQLNALSDPTTQLLGGYMPAMNQVMNALVAAALGQGQRAAPSHARRLYNAALAANLAPLGRMNFLTPGGRAAAQMLAVRNALGVYHQARQAEFEQQQAAQHQHLAGLLQTLQALQSGAGMGMSGLSNKANIAAQYANAVAQMYNPAAHLQGIAEILRGMSRQRQPNPLPRTAPQLPDTLGLRLPTYPGVDARFRELLRQRGGVWSGGLGR